MRFTRNRRDRSRSDDPEADGESAPGKKADSTVWFLRHWVVSVAGVRVRLGIAGFTIPSMVFVSLGNLPAHLDLPLVGIRTAGETAILMVAAMSALYAHEVGHVVAARAVKMPVREVVLDSMFPAVAPADDAPGADDPWRRFWFAAGGPLSDLVCGSVAVMLGAFTQGSLRWMWLGYAAGALLQFLNALPMLASGLALVAFGAALQGRDVPLFPVTLMVAGVALIGARLIGGVAVSDGDQALAAWRQARKRRQAQDGST